MPTLFLCEAVTLLNAGYCSMPAFLFSNEKGEHMEQSEMSFDSPDLTQEQRRCLQAWLKIIHRNASLQPVERRIGYLNWAKRKAQQELTPANFSYFLIAWEKSLKKATAAYERHIQAVRSQNVTV